MWLLSNIYWWPINYLHWSGIALAWRSEDTHTAAFTAHSEVANQLMAPLPMPQRWQASSQPQRTTRLLYRFLIFWAPERTGEPSRMAPKQDLLNSMLLSTHAASPIQSPRSMSHLALSGSPRTLASQHQGSHVADIMGIETWSSISGLFALKRTWNALPAGLRWHCSTIQSSSNLIQHS